MSSSRIFFSIVICCIIIGDGMAQQRNTPGTVEANWNPAGIVVTKKLESQKLEKSYFFNEEWAYGSVYMGGQSKIENFPMKFDIINDRVEILTPEDVKILDGQRIESFVLDPADSEPVKFVNCSMYEYNSSKLMGFFEVLHENRVSLYEIKQVKIQKGYYSPTHDVGDPDDKYIVSTRLYLVEQGNVHDADSKKEMLEYFGDKEDQMKDYAKSNKLSFNKREDVITLIAHYNTLVEL